MDLLSDICPVGFCLFLLPHSGEGWIPLVILLVSREEKEQLMLLPLSVWPVAFRAPGGLCCSTQEHKSITPQHTEKQSIMDRAAQGSERDQEGLRMEAVTAALPPTGKSLQWEKFITSRSTHKVLLPTLSLCLHLPEQLPCSHFYSEMLIK